jgi:intracellular septation protein
VRWALFFLAMAVLNEIIWRTQTTDFGCLQAFGAISVPWGLP